MVSMFSTTEYLPEHTTPIPSSISASKAIGLLHNHEFFIQCDPHMIHYELLPDSLEHPEPEVPDDREVVPIAPAKCYTVTDRVHALPAGLWDSDVVSTYEFFNLEKGVLVRIRSPLSTVMETVWEIRETKDGGCLLVEEVVIKCSRFLVGIVKNTCEAGWVGIHAKMVGKLEEVQVTA